MPRYLEVRTEITQRIERNISAAQYSYCFTGRRDLPRQQCRQSGGAAWLRYQLELAKEIRRCRCDLLFGYRHHLISVLVKMREVARSDLYSEQAISGTLSLVEPHRRRGAGGVVETQRP